ncbi:hypothetical protein ACH4E8_29595 [Streptomyces sp. NPDC017979]|uniref:hypothetical protein n=1 Tax=Streptomyces sp. NPDC017979 TaxID=3365024 RepID=UPI003793AC29
MSARDEVAAAVAEQGALPLGHDRPAVEVQPWLDAADRIAELKASAADAEAGDVS